jgi:hypothetical protein
MYMCVLALCMYQLVFLEGAGENVNGIVTVTVRVAACSFKMLEPTC